MGGEARIQLYGKTNTGLYKMPWNACNLFFFKIFDFNLQLKFMKTRFINKKRS